MGISLKEVSYSYITKKKKYKYILNNINLEINEKDEFITIIGETGSGKSTLASLLNALKLPTKGELDILGFKIKSKRSNKIKYNDIRKRVGLVFQFSDYQLFEDTVLKDVMFAPKNFGKDDKEAEEIAKKALEMVHFPSNLYDKSPFSLSGGEKKLASIAGILAMESDVLIFDEPTAGLDPETKKKVITLFKELNRCYHKTIIVITHDMNIVSNYASRVILLNKGIVEFDGTPYDLFVNNSKIVEENKIGYPDCIRLTKYLNQKLGMNLSLDSKDLDDLIKELKAYE